ncbi:MAG: MFS transporter [Halieaceae bacterium]|nr:MFS transporter [Halieaceae bacterium]
MLFALILAGEVIFSLPFHIPRFFRPNMLEVFQLSNTQLGDIFAVYGVVALLAYFPGGTIADRYPARTLMTLSLAATGLGGLYLWTLPGLLGLYLLFAYWGLTSILLFWAALIKATRDWGGEHTQGMAFGMLDGGRGLVASLFATAATLILAAQLAANGGGQQSLQAVILFYSVVSLLSAAVVWFALPPGNSTGPATSPEGRPHWLQAISTPSVWLQAGVVVCAYCGYKSLDNYGVYAVQVLEMSPLEAAAMNTWASYARPVAAVAAGLWADRWRSSKLVCLLFFCAAAAYFCLSLERAVSMTGALLLANILITFIAVYALRGIYFSLIEEAGLDRRITGSAVGLISVLGFTPDIFFAAITGRILDANPGAAGFHDYFLLIALISAAGMACTLALSRQVAGTKAP